MSFLDAASYDDLPVPSKALEDGGVEMLRVGIVEDELFVTARRAFDNALPWGELLAHVAMRLAMLYAAEGIAGEADVIAEITAGFIATLEGREPAATAPRRRPKPKAARPAPAKLRTKRRAKPPAKPAAKPRATSKPTHAARRKAARAKS